MGTSITLSRDKFHFYIPKVVFLMLNLWNCLEDFWSAALNVVWSSTTSKQSDSIMREDIHAFLATCIPHWTASASTKLTFPLSSVCWIPAATTLPLESLITAPIHAFWYVLLIAASIFNLNTASGGGVHIVCFSIPGPSIQGICVFLTLW